MPTKQYIDVQKQDDINNAIEEILSIVLEKHNLSMASAVFVLEIAKIEVLKECYEEIEDD